MSVKILLISWFSSVTILFSSFALSASNSEVQKNIMQVNQYFSGDKEALPYEEVVHLSGLVIENRQFYSNNIIAKVFILLADTATNKGDLVRAMQFALDGRSLLGIDKKLELSLMLKIANGHYVKGKFNLVKEIAQQAVVLASQIDSPQYLLKSLSYRAMSNALIAEHQLAFTDLKQVELLLEEHQEFTDHIELLETLAIAYFYLNDNEAAVTLYSKIIKLRFDQSRTNNIERIYDSLARAYLKLGQLDDAYNAFWEARNYAKEKNLPLRIAYAELGLGKVLLRQGQSQEALVSLQQAEFLFNGKNLMKPYLNTLIALAKTAKLLERTSLTEEYLLKAESAAGQINLTEEQIELYQLLSQMYESKGKYEKSLAAIQKYVTLYQKFWANNHASERQDHDIITTDKNRQLSLNLAELSELRAQFTNKYHDQEQIILILISGLIILLVMSLFFYLKLRAYKLNRAYEDVEKPNDFIASPSQTKNYYQLHYKMARKYDYPLAVGYLAVDNWQELSFEFNNKIMAEVSKAIATLLNEHNSEFEQVGLINDGEYLFLCPHQNVDTLKDKFNELTEALRSRFFANLGEQSLKISYAYQSPTVLDIDPYIFLSRLSESTRADYKTQV